MRHTLLLLFGLLAACGAPSQPPLSATTVEAGPAASCNKPINSLTGCCSSHGGPKTCSTANEFVFFGTALGCADGSVSPTCTGKFAGTAGPTSVFHFKATSVVNGPQKFTMGWTCINADGSASVAEPNWQATIQWPDQWAETLLTCQTLRLTIELIPPQNANVTANLWKDGSLIKTSTLTSIHASETFDASYN